MKDRGGSRGRGPCPTQNRAGSAASVCREVEQNLTLVLKRQFEKERATQHPPPPFFILPHFPLSLCTCCFLRGEHLPWDLFSWMEGTQFTGNCLVIILRRGCGPWDSVLFPFDPWRCAHPLCGLGRTGRAHPDRLAGGPGPRAVGKLVVTRKSAGFVVCFLRPPLVFPKAWNLKVNNRGLCLKAVSGEWRVWKPYPRTTLAVGRRTFDGCLTAF